MEAYTIDPNTQWENSQNVLDQFKAYRVAYKYIDSQPIHAFFLIPNKLPSGPRPLLVRFHGGGWTEGEADASMRPLYVSCHLIHRY
jgi:cephalosporin-C deacetylase-like acetyl esterase